METIARILLGLGVLLLVAGGLLYLLSRMGISSLPGDISFGRGNLKVYIPLGTSLLLSIVLTVVLNLILRR